jgi:hypothetical protein
LTRKLLGEIDDEQVLVGQLGWLRQIRQKVKRNWTASCSA